MAEKNFLVRTNFEFMANLKKQTSLLSFSLSEFGQFGGNCVVYGLRYFSTKKLVKVVPTFLLRGEGGGNTTKSTASAPWL